MMVVLQYSCDFDVVVGGGGHSAISVERSHESVLLFFFYHFLSPVPFKVVV